MKSFKQILIAGIAFATILPSCSMEKRFYMSGYNNEWFRGTHSPAIQNASVESKKNEENKTLITAQPKKVTVDPFANETIADENITASVNNEQIIFPRKEKNNVLLSHKVKPVAENEQVKPSFKSEFKKGVKRIMAKNDEPKTNGMALAGFICSLAGLFIFGFVLGTLAIIFSAIGLGKINKDASMWKGKGMAIAGLIIGIVDIMAWLILVAVLL